MIIELRGGLLVTAEAIALAVALEDRGHALTARASQLLVSNASALTAEDRAQIRQHRLHLLALAVYEAPV